MCLIFAGRILKDPDSLQSQSKLSAITACEYCNVNTAMKLKTR